MTAEERRALARKNRDNMQGAILRWIEEAKSRPTDGPRLLDAKADWVEQQLRALSKTAELDEDPPSHLEGLTAWELSCAAGDLRIAANRLKAGL